MKTKVFISQSGERSRALAEALKEFVRMLIQATEPWVSTEIPKGAQWPSELAARLAQAGAGMVCLTPENLGEPWILFEAGALSQTEKVWTVLLDVQHSDVAPPLGLYQHTTTETEDVWRMVKSINGTVDSPNDEADLRRVFEKLWPDLNAEIERIRTMPTAGGVAAHRDQNVVLAEVLDIVRETGRVTTWRSDKMLRMLHRVYEAVLHEKAPSLAEMKMRDADRGGSVTTAKDFERLGADPRRSFIADTPLPLKMDDSKN